MKIKKWITRERRRRRRRTDGWKINFFAENVGGRVVDTLNVKTVRILNRRGDCNDMAASREREFILSS